MKTARIALFSSCLLLIGVVTFKSPIITAYSAEVWQLSWTLSYSVPRLLILCLSIAALPLVIPLLKLPRVGKVVVSILMLAAFIGGYLTVNLPYTKEWARSGKPIDYVLETSEVRDVLLNHSPDYNGLVMLALPSCPHCLKQFETLKVLSARTPDLDVSVIVASADSSGVETFKSHVGNSRIPIYRVGGKTEILEFSRGRFPSFLYFKEENVVYRWSNSQFGYPALDWAENRLN